MFSTISVYIATLIVGYSAGVVAHDLPSSPQSRMTVEIIEAQNDLSFVSNTPSPPAASQSTSSFRIDRRATPTFLPDASRATLWHLPDLATCSFDLNAPDNHNIRFTKNDLINLTTWAWWLNDPDQKIWEGK